MISLIVAVDKNFLIGKDGTLPWGHIPEDMKYFRKTTFGHPIVMGRKTFDSIGRALPGRRNMVLTRNKDFSADSVEVFHNTQQVLGALEQESETFIIGGSQIYKEFLPYTNKIYITFIDGEFSGDTNFPLQDFRKWRKIKDTSTITADNQKISFLVYERKNEA